MLSYFYLKDFYSSTLAVDLVIFGLVWFANFIVLMFSGFLCWYWKLSCHFILERVVCLFLLLLFCHLTRMWMVKMPLITIFLLWHHTAENQTKAGRVVWAPVVSLVGWVLVYGCVWGDYHSRRHRARQLRGKRGGWETVRSEGQATPFKCILPAPRLLKQSYLLIAHSALTWGWISLICMVSILSVAPRAENQAFHT